MTKVKYYDASMTTYRPTLDLRESLTRPRCLMMLLLLLLLVVVTSTAAATEGGRNEIYVAWPRQTDLVASRQSSSSLLGRLIAVAAGGNDSDSGHSQVGVKLNTTDGQTRLAAVTRSHCHRDYAESIGLPLFTSRIICQLSSLGNYFRRRLKRLSRLCICHRLRRYEWSPLCYIIVINDNKKDSNKM